MIAQIGMLLQLCVLEALPAEEDVRPPRGHREPPDGGHDAVVHPLGLLAGQALEGGAVAGVLRAGEDDHAEVVGFWDVA